ncbi:hypothetical protein F2Q70_00041199 [Brassica cretica]|uniref:B box-type domain-containing protein n=1 Tax=Brassica cretica TaxID=69181 RepID=A0A8S9K5W1_BRACR|nr:hypothetical protein F2Q70_00041199 [Brassica cretica]
MNLTKASVNLFQTVFILNSSSSESGTTFCPAVQRFCKKDEHKTSSQGKWSIVLQSCSISFLMSNMVKKPLESKGLWSSLPSKASKLPCPSGSLSLSKKRSFQKVAPLKHEERRSLWCDGYKKEVMYLKRGNTQGAVKKRSKEEPVDLSAAVEVMHSWFQDSMLLTSKLGPSLIFSVSSLKRGTWKSLYQKLVVPTPFEDGKESEERGRHQTSQEKGSEMLVCASYGVHPCSTKYSSDRLIADLTHALEFHGRPLLGRQMRLEVSQQRGQRHTYTPQSSGDMEHGISANLSIHLLMETREFPAWLEVLLKEKFFNACLDHEEEKKNEKNILCIDCCLSICPHCLPSHTSHRLLRIRRYMYNDVLRVEDGSKLMDCSLIQPYIVNSSKVVFINERPHPRQFRGSGNFCSTCDRSLQSPYLFCSLSCKISDVIMRQRGLSGFLRVCNFLNLTEDVTTSTLEPSGSDGDGGVDMFLCQALACTAATEIVRKKRSSLTTTCRRVTTAVSSASTEAPANFFNRRKNTPPQRAPLY